MKSGFDLVRPALIAIAAAALLSGCLLKKSTLPVRYFVLSPVATNEPAVASTEPIAVGVSLVKMPSYLLRDSMAIRNSANEIQYLEGALWGEHLDQSFQRAVVANLSRLLASDRIYPEWTRGQVTLRVYISVQQFEVDTHGRGTLIANWRIAGAESEVPLKNGIARLNHAGTANDPKAIAAAMSELTGEFSRNLAQAIQESAKK
jgi:uncharacterized lipoprotein YmbA